MNESDSNLGSSKPEVSLYGYFESSYLTGFDLYDDMPFYSITQENNLPMSLSLDLALKTGSHNDVTNDISIIIGLPYPFTQSFEFEEGEEFESARELDTNITNIIKHHDLNESEDISLWESYENVVKVRPINLKFDNDHFSME